MTDRDDLTDMPVGPVDASGEPDRQDDLPAEPGAAGLVEDERSPEAVDDDDLPADAPEDNPDDLRV